ncbi:hypothetical protein PR202_gb11820 [Eleusine coracana subsp. coracana]|uniref:Uncharacterized protein n=1 Tax=Eleusine coracana subsp. coracana TaxID=191504 RepID=A0AAV5ENT3_ELECO|nr:hypothetical protein PR202_gb11820 [Eleusine coracana subsp. coracana]
MLSLEGQAERGGGHRVRAKPREVEDAVEGAGSALPAHEGARFATARQRGGRIHHHPPKTGLDWPSPSHEGPGSVAACTRVGRIGRPPATRGTDPQRGRKVARRKKCEAPPVAEEGGRGWIRATARRRGGRGGAALSSHRGRKGKRHRRQSRRPRDGSD